jgi:hypothetical protein
MTNPNKNFDDPVKAYQESLQRFKTFSTLVHTITFALALPVLTNVIYMAVKLKFMLLFSPVTSSVTLGSFALFGLLSILVEWFRPRPPRPPLLAAMQAHALLVEAHSNDSDNDDPDNSADPANSMAPASRTVDPAIRSAAWRVRVIHRFFTNQAEPPASTRIAIPQHLEQRVMAEADKAEHNALICPISGELMRDPVKLKPTDKQAFDRQSIIALFAYNPQATHPLTREEIKREEISSCQTTKDQINALIEKVQNMVAEASEALQFTAVQGAASQKNSNSRRELTMTVAGM